MATVTGFTAERMLAMEDATVIDGNVVGTNLILVTKGGTQIDTGSVQGPVGPTGPKGDPGTNGVDGATIPVGQIANYPKSPLPPGWLACDGTIYNIATYPALGAYLGATYGGNGTTTFAVPNYKGRVMVDLDTGQAEFNVVGLQGGAKVVALGINEMPVHSHSSTLAAPGHTHAMPHDHTPNGGPAYGFLVGHAGGPMQGPAAGAGVRIDAATTQPNNGSTQGASATALTGGIANNGSGGAHNNLQPYSVVITAIKT